MQRFKRLIHWLHFDSVPDDLHVLTVENFVLHLAAEFLSERKSSIFQLQTGEIMKHSSSVKFDFEPR